jgi:hypothetical protein
MRYAVQNDYIDSNPASDMAGALSTTKARHYPALPSSRFPEFLARLAAYRGRMMTRTPFLYSLLFVPVSYALRGGMSSTLKKQWPYQQSEKKLKACVTLIVSMKMKENTSFLTTTGDGIVRRA